MNKAIYFFYGEEDFLIEEKVRSLKQQFAGSALNLETIDNENYSAEQISAALCTQSLLAEEKMVIFRDFKIDPDLQDALIASLENISPGIKAIFQAKSADRRSKFFKWINQRGEALEFKTFAPWEQAALFDWIRKRARQGGKTLSEGGAHLLHEVCGSNLRLLASEIEKLITYVGERQEVTEEDVARLASPGEINAFALLEALRLKKTSQSLNLFQQLLKGKEDMFQLTGLLAHQYRTMLQVKSLNSRDPNRLAGAIGGSPFFIKKCLENIDDFSLDELKENLIQLLGVNLKLKTGEQKETAFALLLVFLCRGKHA